MQLADVTARANCPIRLLIMSGWRPILFTPGGNRWPFGKSPVSTFCVTRKNLAKIFSHAFAGNDRPSGSSTVRLSQYRWSSLSNTPPWLFRCEPVLLVLVPRGLHTRPVGVPPRLRGVHAAHAGRRPARARGRHRDTRARAAAAQLPELARGRAADQHPGLRLPSRSAGLWLVVPVSRDLQLSLWLV